MKDDKFISNLIEFARNSYVKTYNLAINSDFCKNKEKLKKLDDIVFETYAKKKPKKVLFALVYASCKLYNNEIIVDCDLSQNLTFLTLLLEYKLYRLKTLLRFGKQNMYILCANSGIGYIKTTKIIENILQGVENVNYS